MIVSWTIICSDPEHIVCPNVQIFYQIMQLFPSLKNTEIIQQIQRPIVYLWKETCTWLLSIFQYYQWWWWWWLKLSVIKLSTNCYYQYYLDKHNNAHTATKADCSIDITKLSEKQQIIYHKRHKYSMGIKKTDTECVVLYVHSLLLEKIGDGYFFWGKGRLYTVNLLSMYMASRR